MNSRPFQVNDVTASSSLSPEALAAQQMILKLQTICKILDWTAGKPSDSIYHTYLSASMPGYPGASVSMIHGQYPHKDRIMVTASTRHDASIYRYGEEPLRITVGGTRTPEEIAKEIERRFIPKFIEIAVKAGAIQKNHDDYQCGMERCLGRLKGTALAEDEVKNRRFQLDLDGMWGEVQYGGDDTVAFYVHNVQSEKADRILAILREKTGSAREESQDSNSERRSHHE